VRLSPALFNQFLGSSVRQDFMWRRRSACPCVSASSGAARYDCPVCNGKGHIWASAEVPGWAGMSNQIPKKSATPINWEPGDATLTIPSDSPLYGVRQYDRIRALGSTNPFSEVIVPGRNDKLRMPVVSVSRVFWLATDGETIVEGGIPTVAANGAMTWASGAPPAETSFTVEGTREDEFFVYDSLASDRNSGVSGLPLKLQARKFDLLGR
jgi:hypothetical protein